MTNAEIFEDIYRRKVWGEGSGGGSGPEASAPYVEFVNRIIAREKPLTILDIGCGDGQVASRLDLDGTIYMGIDPSESALSLARMQCPHLEFFRGDLIGLFHFLAPDLVLCKEATQHMDDLNLDYYVAFVKRARSVIHCSATQPGDSVRVRGGYAPFRLSSEMKVEESHEWAWGTGGYVVEFARGKRQ